MFILVNNEKIVSCMATEKSNLHTDKIVAGHQIFETQEIGRIGDEFNEETGWTSRPENYPQLTWKELRREAYPPDGDQFDAYMKGFEAIINGDPIPQETIDMVIACRAVKDRFPKLGE